MEAENILLEPQLSPQSNNFMDQSFFDNPPENFPQELILFGQSLNNVLAANNSVENPPALQQANNLPLIHVNEEEEKVEEEDENLIRRSLEYTREELKADLPLTRQQKRNRNSLIIYDSDVEFDTDDD